MIKRTVAFLTPSLFALFIAFSCPHVIAGGISEAQALTAAQNWLTGAGSLATLAADGSPRQIATITALRATPSADPMAYAVHLQPSGYIILSSNDRLRPVKAFSANTTLNFSDTPGNAFRALLIREAQLAANGTKISETVATLSDPESANSQRWAELLAAQEGTIAPLNAPTGTHLMTTTWNQNRHYNALCPAYPGATGWWDEHVPVGCTAVAGAQIMNHFQWPPHGTGSALYSDVWGTLTGSHAAGYADPYDWSSMQESYDPWSDQPQAAVDAVSELMYELGVAAYMDYETNGSSSAATTMTSSLKANAFYDRGSYLLATDPTYANQLRDAILAGHPTLVTIPGHAVVADGHTTIDSADWFHINYGWGGDNDGWYQIGAVDGNPLQDAVIGFVPAAIPLFAAEEYGTLSAAGMVYLSWVYPQNQVADTTQIRLLQAVSTNVFEDNCDTFDIFIPSTGEGGVDWVIDPTEGNNGTSCFHAGEPVYVGAEAYLTLSDPVTVSAATSLSFFARRYLSGDGFKVEISPDDGATYIPLLSWTESENDSPSATMLQYTLDLSAYAGQAVLIRFVYIGGTYWQGALTRVFIDDIAISSVERTTWKAVATTPAATSGSFFLGDLEPGDTAFTLQAHQPSGWGTRSPSLTVTAVEDDGDGMPADWELANGLDPTTDDGDGNADDDPLSNFQEFVAGTQPTNSASFPCIADITLLNSNRVLCFATITNRQYRVLGAAAADAPSYTWIPVAGDVAGTGAQQSISDTSAMPVRFYRLQIEYNPVP